MKTKNLVYIGRRLTDRNTLTQVFQDSKGVESWFTGVRYAFIGFYYPVHLKGKSLSISRSVEPIEGMKATAAEIRRWEAHELAAVEKHKTIRDMVRAKEKGPELMRALEPLAIVMKDLTMGEASALIKHVCMKFWMKNGGKRL